MQVRSFCLLYVLVLTAVHMAVQDPASLAVGRDLPMWHCFIYQHVHASWIHLLCNSWAMLSIVFFWRPSYMQIFCAYALSAVFGAIACRYDLPPTVGLSGLIYAIFGMFCLTPATRQGLIRYQATIMASMAICFIFPGISMACHAWCYAMGVFYAIINFPIRYD